MFCHVSIKQRFNWLLLKGFFSNFSFFGTFNRHLTYAPLPRRKIIIDYFAAWAERVCLSPLKPSKWTVEILTQFFLHRINLHAKHLYIYLNEIFLTLSNETLHALKSEDNWSKSSSWPFWQFSWALYTNFERSEHGKYSETGFVSLMCFSKE